MATSTKAKGRKPKAKTPAPPVVPSKWDIIPIHTSDRGAFKQCRRRWAWSSPSRRNLVPRVSSHGVRMPLWFGTGIHRALQHFYGKLTEDPVAVFESWYDVQWNGGLIHETELDEYGDRLPEPVEGQEGIYRVKGLEELLGDADEKREEFEQHLELARGMLNYYVEYAPEHDDFRVVQIEHMFSVPVLDPDGNVLYAEDRRQMPEQWLDEFEARSVPENTYGQLWILGPQHRVMKQVHARGRMDVIVQLLDSGVYGIRDYKTVGKLDDDYFRHLDLDEQCTTYLWAAPLEAELYGYEYTEVNFIDYVALRKAFPRPPTITSRGLPSIDRQKESTTAEMFEQCIKDNNLDVIFNNDVKMQEYYTYLVTKGEKQFIWPERVRRNKTQIANAGLRLYYEALDMLDKDIVLYPNPSKDYTCINCVFRAPCIAAEDGSDWQAMLQGNYIENYDR